jgi:hypothetical protein
MLHSKTVSRFSLASLVRCVAAATGAAAGVMLALPIGSFLAVVLFKEVGAPLAKRIVTDALAQSDSAIETIVVAIFLTIAALMLAVYVVIVLVAPVFILVPMLASAAALRLAHAGLITRTLWLWLGLSVFLAVVLLPASSPFHVRPDWWLWALMVSTAGFVGRLIVELWQPELAGTPASVGDTLRRWKTLLLVWAVLLSVAIIALVTLARFRVA